MAGRLFADVILPLAIPNLLTYEVSALHADEVAIGKRVIVQLGKQKFYSAVIRRLHGNPPSGYEVKEISSMLDDQPIVNETQLKFWEWLSEYYMCTIGEVMNAALPAALKLQSESKIILNPEFENENEQQLPEKEFLVYQALLSRHELTLSEVAVILHRKSAHGVVKDMIDRGVVLLSEEVRDKYSPKYITRISLGANYLNEDALQEVFDVLSKRSPKQLEALMVFMKTLYRENESQSVLKSDLLKDEKVSSAAIASLVKKEILREEKILTNRISTGEMISKVPLELSRAQDKCLTEIKKQFEKEEIILLHGVTSSGKTELYIHLIHEMLKQGKQVLYLLPEIALTSQMISRLRKHFGSAVGIYHSRQNSNERVEVWKAVKDFQGKDGVRTAQVILGARSALFLPYSDLGLVIVDEEHDASFKQNDPAPRYHGRDTALVLAKLFSAKTLMGSATPSLESFFNVKEKKYGYVNLSERFGGMEMPEIKVCDVKEASRRRQMKSHFTPEMIEVIEKALAGREQVILFQNRRGFAPVLECANCSWIPQCKNCSVTLTYHKQINLLKCHYCGYTSNPPAICQRCGDHHLEIKGFGTEKIEEEISIFFPDAIIRRLDLDSTRSKNAYHKIISDFETRKIDILVGTQMVTKGLDFENVSTVGIINADQMLNFPDFRAHERAFQLMSQVSGRSGRKRKRGSVLIQTHQPEHWVIRLVADHDYEGFYERDLHERKKFGYPPHTRLIEILLKHRDADVLHEKSELFGRDLKSVLGSRVIGPHQPLVFRIKNLYINRILIKVEKEASTKKIKDLIKKQLEKFYSDRKNHSVLVVIDVDPV